MHGDDIGLEVVPEAVKVMKAAAAETGLAIEWHELLIGKAGHDKYGDTLPKITEDTLRTDSTDGSWARSATAPIRAAT